MKIPDDVAMVVPLVLGFVRSFALSWSQSKETRNGQQGLQRTWGRGPFGSNRFFFKETAAYLLFGSKEWKIWYVVIFILELQKNSSARPHLLEILSVHMEKWCNFLCRIRHVKRPIDVSSKEAQHDGPTKRCSMTFHLFLARSDNLFMLIRTMTGSR